MIRAAPHFWWLRWLSSAFWISLTSCAGSSAPTAPQPGGQPAAARNVVLPLPEEGHLADLRQLTFGGENAEAYWSFDGMQLILQARPATAACDRILRMSINESAPSLIPVSSGKGATTCSYFLPGDQDVIFASTHLGGDACPPKPDHSQGYVWALHDSYDIFRAKADGGAFFNADCTKIVWRASRPKPGAEADEYKRLLAKRLVKPTKLEIYTANADGSDPVQITYLDAASFAPFWHPSQKRVLFSSNYGDPKGREFDLWAIDVNGTNLERVTFARGFDGFPMFSPDGKYLAFSSNRATAPGSHDTNVFVARWVDSAPKPVAELPADRIFADIRWLADPLREGRGVGTTGLAAAGEYLEKRYRDLGLAPAGDGASYRQ